MSPKQKELPILHDVVEPPNAGVFAVPDGERDPTGQQVVPNVPSLSAAEINEERVAQRVLAELLRQTDLIPEQRLREVLQPTLDRFTDALIHDARLELAATLREVIMQELARLRRH